MAWLQSTVQVIHIRDKQIGFYRIDIHVLEANSWFSRIRSVSVALQLGCTKTGL